ncbi:MULTISPECIES: hypothetical protein [unclassified Acinetobacter]|nr:MULTISPECIES: hypothetical protein [unclassified Acinetobacter]
MAEPLAKGESARQLRIYNAMVASMQHPLDWLGADLNILNDF